MLTNFIIGCTIGGIIVIAIIIFYLFTSVPAQTVPVAPAITVPITPIAPTISTSSCDRGWYCNGTPVPLDVAVEGHMVCGGENKLYKCVKQEDGTMSWHYQQTLCPTGMLNRCN